MVATAYQAGVNALDYLIVLQRHAEAVKAQLPQVEEQRLRFFERRRHLEHRQNLTPRRPPVAGPGQRPGELITRLQPVGRIERHDRPPFPYRPRVIVQSLGCFRQAGVDALVVRPDPDQALDGRRRPGRIAQALAQLRLECVRLPRRLVPARELTELLHCGAQITAVAIQLGQLPRRRVGTVGLREHALRAFQHRTRGIQSPAGDQGLTRRQGIDELPCRGFAVALARSNHPQPAGEALTHPAVEPAVQVFGRQSEHSRKCCFRVQAVAIRREQRHNRARPALGLDHFTYE